MAIHLRGGGGCFGPAAWFRRRKRRVPGHGIFETTTHSAGKDEENPEKDFTGVEELRRPTMAGGRKFLETACMREEDAGHARARERGARGLKLVFYTARERE
jgi:hypothetical protein